MIILGVQYRIVNIFCKQLLQRDVFTISDYILCQIKAKELIYSKWASRPASDPYSRRDVIGA